MLSLKQLEADAIRSRMKDYPVEAQADIERLLSLCVEKKKRTIKDSEYSTAFNDLWLSLPKERRTNKAEAWATLKARVKDASFSEDQLIDSLARYILDQKRKQTEPKYWLMVSSFFGPVKRRYEDYITTDKPFDQKTEPDWWERAGKLIRDMTITERAVYGVPYPLPIELDAERGFGRDCVN